nr:hypothetical protein [uncultured Undibacterium sp.]
MNRQFSSLAASAPALLSACTYALTGLLACSLACLLLSPIPAVAQTSEQPPRARDVEWTSYRDAYKSMLWFEKFGKAKNLIQFQLQVVPKDKNSSMENYGLHILGKTIHLNLPLDPLGRTALPLLKAAYDENAELVLNQKSGQASFHFRTSLSLRADGIYEINELRAACEQALAYQNYIDPTSMKTKKCIGIRLGFAKKDFAAQVELKLPSTSSQILSLSDNSSLWADGINNVKALNFLFAQHPEKGHLFTRTSPLGMIALIE